LYREKVIASQPVYDGRAVSLRVDTVSMPDGRQTTREVVVHSDCVAIIAVDEADNILLVNQFRYAVGKDLLEIPAGGIEPGEDEQTTVTRELREETGYAPAKVVRLGGFYSSPGFCNEYLHLYLATGLSYSPLHAEDTDSISLVRVPVAEVYDLIDSGAICDAKSIIGLLTFRQLCQGKPH